MEPDKTLTIVAALTSHKQPDPTVQCYYNSFESRVGYWALLGNARHCGLWEPGTIWPFPISIAQQAMEERLYERLDLHDGAKVLDAGMGSGLVAVFMATHGLNIHGVDITPAHVEQARKNVISRALSDKVTTQYGDYHDLKEFKDAYFDGVYTMEAFVHADDPTQVLRNFKRLLRPGGVLVLHEADFNTDSPILQDVLRLSHCQNTLQEGAYELLLQDAGFTNITIEDLSDEVLPLWRLLWILGSVPYEILRLFHLQSRLINIMAGVETYRHWGEGRYVSIRAVKPQAAERHHSLTQATNLTET